MKNFAALTSAALLLTLLTGAAPPPGVSDGRIDFNEPGLRISAWPQNWEEAVAGYPARRAAIFWTQALRPIPPVFNRTQSGGAFPSILFAKLEVGFEIDEVNRAILDPRIRVYGESGTDWHDIKLCEREGDYDFTLVSWMKILHRFWNDPSRLRPSTRWKILHQLSPETGNRPIYTRRICGLPIPETENHILMTEGSRYLTNQLLNRERREKGLGDDPAFDNERNGMNKWMLTHLQFFMAHDFAEYNSRPYAPYAMEAVQNLVEYAEDIRIKTAARNILDYLSAKFAVSSLGLRRLPTFSRNPNYRANWGTFRPDGVSQRMFGHSGLMTPLDHPERGGVMDFGHELSFGAVYGDYQLPAPVGDLLFRKDASYFERLHHHSVEVYARAPEFLLSSGGLYVAAHSVPWTMPDDGFPMPLLLIPAARLQTPGQPEEDAHGLIRFEGHSDPEKRSNLCVAPGFACGLNPVVPPEILKDARVAGPWTFVRGPGYHVALYADACTGRFCGDGARRYGFMEVASATPPGALTFEQFISRVYELNGHRRFQEYAKNTYVATDGREIVFQPVTSDKWYYPVTSVGGRALDPMTTKWPLAEGEFLQADGKGLVRISNPWTGQTLVLDSRDAMNPRRSQNY